MQADAEKIFISIFANESKYSPPAEIQSDMMLFSL